MIDDRQETAAIRLMLGYLCVATELESSLVRKVKILDRFKLVDGEIAKICGCSVQSVRNARFVGRRRSPRRKKKDHA